MQEACMWVKPSVVARLSSLLHVLHLVRCGLMWQSPGGAVHTDWQSPQHHQHTAPTTCQYCLPRCDPLFCIAGGGPAQATSPTPAPQVPAAPPGPPGRSHPAQYSRPPTPSHPSKAAAWSRSRCQVQQGRATARCRTQVRPRARAPSRCTAASLRSV